MPTLPAARERGPEEPMSPLALPRAATEEDDAAEWVSPRVGQRVMVLRDPWLLWIWMVRKQMEIRNKRARLGPAWLGQGGKVYGKVNIIAAMPMTETNSRLLSRAFVAGRCAHDIQNHLRPQISRATRAPKASALLAPYRRHWLEHLPHQ